MARGNRSSGREGEAAGEAPKLHQAAFGRGLLGLAAASAAITMAISEPPPGLNKTAYFLVLTGAFFAGVIQVVASVQAAGCHPHAAGRKLANACVVLPAGVAAGLTVASLLLQ